MSPTQPVLVLLVLTSTSQHQKNNTIMRGAFFLFLLLSMLVESIHGQNDYAEYARGESIVVLDLQPADGAQFLLFPVSYLCYPILSCDASV